jgi:hypothetical protein
MITNNVIIGANAPSSIKIVNENEKRHIENERNIVENERVNFVNFWHGVMDIQSRYKSNGEVRFDKSAISRSLEYSSMSQVKVVIVFQTLC